jgi:hypothetical protein
MLQAFVQNQVMIEELDPPRPYGAWHDYLLPDPSHATEVALLIAGPGTSVCGKGKVTLVSVSPLFSTPSRLGCTLKCRVA